MSANCKFEKHCGHRSQKHNLMDCLNKHLEPACANCGINHQTDSYDCQIYLNQIQKVYNSRLFLSPNLSLKLYKTTMKHKTANFVQLNICAISEHSKTALEKFLDEKRPYFVCLNETKTFLKSDFFNNFHTEASQTGKSGGVALLVNQEILYTRINDLECPDLDSVCILGSLVKLKLLIASAYIRPNSIDCLKSFLQRLEAAQQFNKCNQLDGFIFWVTLTLDMNIGVTLLTIFMS